MNANHILVIPHQNPDGDALGSCTALIEVFDRLNKKSSAYCRTETGSRYGFLPHINRVMNDANIWQDQTIDLVIVLDSSDPAYAGIAEHIGKLSPDTKLAVIDHHATNTNYGHLNMVKANASSTCELIYEFLFHNNIKLNSNLATSLMTGILFDTDNFTNSGTTGRSLQIGHHLMIAGAGMHTIMDSVFRDKTVNTLKLWGAALSRLERHPELDITYTFVSQEDLHEFNMTEKEVEGIANYTNNIAATRATLVLRELTDGNCKASFRTIHDDADVSEIAKALGGGGHKKAAGATVPGSIDTAFQNIFGTMKSLPNKAFSRR